MRSRHAIQEIQISLHQMRVAKGQCLRDVPFDDLAPEFKAELRREARDIFFNTGLTVRRVRRGRRRVWRFIDKDLC